MEWEKFLDIPSYERKLIDRKTVDRIEQFKNRLSELTEEGRKLDEKIDDLETRAHMEDVTGDEEPVFDYRNEQREVEQSRQIIIEKCEELQKEVTEIIEKLPDARYDKRLLYDNILYLMDKLGVKIGQIEEASNCSRGYFARLRKDIETAEPGLNFILAAAELLATDILTLLFVDVSGLTETERSVMGFITALHKDTKAGEVKWERDVYLGGRNKLDHPIAGADEKNRFQYINAEDYVLSLSKAQGIKATLPTNREDTVYIMYGRVDYRQGAEYVYEIYISNIIDGLMRIFNARDKTSTLYRAIKDLYETADRTVGETPLNDSARQAMARYMMHTRANGEAKEGTE